MAYKILYIEDKPDNMRLVLKVLEGDAEKALEAGCGAYMPRPVNINVLYARAEKYLSGNGE